MRLSFKRIGSARAAYLTLISGLLMAALLTVPLIGAPRRAPPRPWTVKADKGPVPVPAVQTLEVDGLKVRHHAAPNQTAFGATLGLRVPDDPRMTVEFLLMESHLLKRGGTAEAPDDAFQALLANQGLELTVEVDPEVLTLSVRAVPGQEREALQLLASLAKDPSLSVSTLTEGKEALETLRKSREATPFLEEMDRVTQRLGPGGDARGRLSSRGLEALTPENMKTLHQVLFCPQHALLGVAGALTGDALGSLLAETFGGWRPCKTVGETSTTASTPPAAPAPPAVSTTDAPEVPSDGALVVGRRLALQTPLELATAHVVTRLLERSLLERLEGRASGARLQEGRAGQLLLSYVENRDDAAALAAEVARVREGRFSAAEVAAALRAEVASLMQALESPAALMCHSVRSELRTGERFLDVRQLEALKSLGVERVRKAAARYLSAPGPSTAEGAAPAGREAKPAKKPARGKSGRKVSSRRRPR